MTIKSTEKQMKEKSHRIKYRWLLPPHLTSQIVPHLIPAVGGVRKDRVNAPQSLCLCWPPLVHADEGGERQDQVSTGQRDVRAPCAPVWRGVSRCEGKEENLWLVLIALSPRFSLRLEAFFKKRFALRGASKRGQTVMFKCPFTCWPEDFSDVYWTFTTKLCACFSGDSALGVLSFI